MPKYSQRSLINLSECHPDLQKLFEEVIKHFDCSIIDGKRSKEEQQKNVEKGVSKTFDSKHLEQEDGKSHAVDVMPYPFDWNKIQKGLDAAKLADKELQVCRSYYFAGFVKGIATMMGISIRQGVDWDGDTLVGDHSFIDLPHNEI